MAATGRASRRAGSTDTLKDDADASWDFAGPACRLCTDKRWTVVQKQLPLPTGPYRESRYVAVRDGTLLAMNIYRPAVDGVPGGVATSGGLLVHALSRALPERRRARSSSLDSSRATA